MRCNNLVNIIPNGHTKAVNVPCGKCIPCLMKKRADWSFRLEQEFKVAKTAMFVTLTYDRYNLKRVNYQLSKTDVQLFMKRVRKRKKHIRIRYYAVGEYGTKTKRPHYHIILFNCDEETVRKAWVLPKTKLPIGLIHIGKVTQASINYTLKYVVQPRDVPEGIAKPFSLMSRGYGLGGHYLTTEMMDWHRSGDKNYTLIYGEKKALPRFYRDKIWPKHHGKKRISEAAKRLSIKAQRDELREAKKIWGKDFKQKLKEQQLAVIQNVQDKLKHSQKF